jgi:glycine cleavage system H lipoate-binding protein
LRFGLDAFAAAILGRCERIACHASGDFFASGEPLCQIDLGLGALSIGAPIRWSLVRGNPTLRDRPEMLVTAPCTEGWIAELMAEDIADLEHLTPAALSRERTRLDLQHFRRRVAMQLLADDADRVGRTMADGGELLTDLRQVLGGPKYLDIVRELIY